MFTKLAIVLSFGAFPSLAHAQAWVGEPNSLSASFGYSFAFSSKIVETDGESLDSGPINHHTFNVGIEYVTPLEGLALTASLPMLLVSWDLEKAGEDGMRFGPHGEWDDGSYHFRPTDLRLGARYNVLNYVESPVALSIIFAGTIPTNNYPTQGFAAVGRGLWQLHFGAAIGSTFSPFLPNLYLHAQYEFVFVERFKTEFPETEDYVQHHSDVSFQIGYFIIEGLELHVALDARIAHGGFDFADWINVSQAVRDFHDPLLRETVVLVGGGGSYSVLDWLSIDLLFRIFTYGTNTRNAHLVGLGMSFQIL